MTASSPDRPEISVILPCFNEQDNVERLSRELRDALEQMRRPYEIIFVDDGSTDETRTRLRGLRREIPQLRLLAHTGNYGESAAEASGFSQARGSILATMDSDGQNDPADLARLIDGLKDADVVCGVRQVREDDWLRRLSSVVANRFRNFVTGDQITDAGCTYRAIRREALAELPVFNGMHRFLPTLLRLQGFRVVELTVNDRARHAGVSKYGVRNRMFRGILDCLAIRWWRRRAVPGTRVHEPDDPMSGDMH